MPCTFDAYDHRHSVAWRSADHQLRPSATEHFHVIYGLRGGGCGHCRATQNGIAWGSSHYVLCQRCAMTSFGAPNLREVAPEVFENDDSPDSTEDDMYEDTPENLATKKDKDFDPRKYKQYRHSGALSGRHGCQGYRCQTYAAPERTIPANELFMLGEASRGHLCIACYDKLKAKWDALPDRAECGYCHRRVVAARMVPVIGYRNPTVCQSCRHDYFIQCPETDGGWVNRDGIQYAMTEGTADTPARRLYASPAYALRHWIRGREIWYMTEEQADRELFSLDATYRDRKIQEHAGQSIFSYGTNVVKMHGFPTITKRDDLCLGVELEMQPNRNHTHDNLVSALGGKFVDGRPYILCRDSSIGSAGVEMITLPYTLANHKSDKYVPWTKVLTELRKVGQSGQNTTQCGMHVHINQRALSNLQLGKMMVIINAPEMQELVATIAQRNEASYCRRYFKKVADGGKIISEEHHGALSTSKGKGTAELRIFRGNLRYERVMKNLEFADALANYANEQSIQKIHMPEEMVAWIRDNKGFYPFLCKFLAEEYAPSKAYARTAARMRKENNWAEAVAFVNIEPTEGDI